MLFYRKSTCLWLLSEYSGHAPTRNRKPKLEQLTILCTKFLTLGKDPASGCSRTRLSTVKINSITFHNKFLLNKWLYNVLTHSECLILTAQWPFLDFSHVSYLLEMSNNFTSMLLYSTPPPPPPPPLLYSPPYPGVVVVITRLATSSKQDSILSPLISGS